MNAASHTAVEKEVGMEEQGALPGCEATVGSQGQTKPQSEAKAGKPRYEAIDREQLCWRPIDIERLIGQVESQLQKLGKAEVSSRVVGDLVIDGLKEMDQIAYIRYAIVYLGLDDLHEIRKEIDHLLES